MSKIMRTPLRATPLLLGCLKEGSEYRGNSVTSDPATEMQRADAESKTCGRCADISEAFGFGKNLLKD
jgi:hypothetical protein